LTILDDSSELLGRQRTYNQQIKQGIMYSYDHHELTSAFATFTYKVIEFRLKEFTKVYRVLINNLIEGTKSFSIRKKKSSLNLSLNWSRVLR